jgi:uncharacterized protein (DUF1501 family)
MTIDRRAFLARGLGWATVSALVPRFGVFGTTKLFEESIEASADRILVVLELAGGNDGLNTVVPYTDSLYAVHRARIGVAATSVLDLDGMLGFNPVMASLKSLWDAGRVAIVQGVSYPNPNLSHFTSRDIWHTADPRLADRRGWLGRYADRHLAGSGNPLSACAISQSLPRTLLADSVVIPSFTSLNAYSYVTDGANPGDSNNQVTAFVAQNSMQYEIPTDVDRVGSTARDAQSSSVQLRQLAAAYTPSVTYPNSSLANALRLCAQIITGGVGTQILYVTYGGFDNHSNQRADHDNLLRNVSDAIKAFFDDLDAKNKSSNVLLMTWSEFGRRVPENGSLGTDHGTAGVQFLVGSGVNRGIYGERPNLGALDRNGNLSWQIDFRAYYGSVLQDWMRADAGAILGPGYPNLGCVNRSYT